MAKDKCTVDDQTVFYLLKRACPLFVWTSMAEGSVAGP